ncbi:nucleotidyltransferase domain-containing protein [Massilia sp. DWR3-1-1]|uniref:nucleotidyltransferase domain-containing protein n=1 Tax=Massilia sp. DWR3-1-1 TaxID=2804559 RepID=UPI003CE6B478
MKAAAPLPLLVRVLRAPAAVGACSLADWDLILRQALSANLSAGLEAALAGAGLLEQVPAPARRHLDWARRMAERHMRAVRQEVACLAEALDALALPLILLKGAAYVMADAPAARGRLFSDIDILVPAARIEAVESALMLHGWVTSNDDAYDQRYYREWMHELPPMHNIRRQTMLDVHHAILPPTARVHPDSALLRADAVAVPCAVNGAAVLTLSPADMVLHSATHLFFDGEFDHGLRDMVDLDRLLRQFGADPAFWDALSARAARLELARPLFYALRYAQWLFDTPVPAAVMAEVDRLARPGALLLALMDAMFERTLLPSHASCSDALTAPARFCLYLRGNWLRMPPLMLARHLFHKAFLSPKTTPAQ